MSAFAGAAARAGRAGRGLVPTGQLLTPEVWRPPSGAFVRAASVAYLVNRRLSEHQAIEISRLVSRLEGLARTDPLTGVPNRRVWEFVLCCRPAHSTTRPDRRTAKLLERADQALDAAKAEGRNRYVLAS